MATPGLARSFGERRLGSAMYERFYGFRHSPFNITPDPRFLFFSEQHREAYDHLLYGIRERKGFIQLTGEVGTGKTTLCRAFLERLGDHYSTALILHPVMTGTQMLRTILTELHLEAPRERIACLEKLNAFLLEQLARDRDVLLVIDEAQDLGPELLEEVRLLSNLETDQRKLLQIILVGQPELRQMLDSKRLRQLRQRITVRYHLAPLTFHETEHYIEHRLLVAGAQHDRLFSPWALRRIYRYARGIPRLINAVCDKTLLCGYVTESDRLGFQHVGRAIRELEGRIR